MAALANPVVVPPGWQYSYEATPGEDYYDDVSGYQTVRHDALSAAERDLFRQLLENGTVTLDEIPDGEHLDAGSDETALSVVDDSGRRFVVESHGDRENFGVRYWGPPVLFVLAALAVALAVVSLVVGNLRSRRRRH